MAIGEAWWDQLHECQGMLDGGEVVASRKRLRNLFNCLKAAAEPSVLDLLDDTDRAELHRLTRSFRLVWRRAQLSWLLLN